MAERQFDALASFLGDKYGLSVEVGLSPVSDSAAQSPTMAVEYANLRDGRIRLSSARSEEQQSFVLAHVFGHLVQYLDADRYAPLVRKVERVPPIRFTPAEELEPPGCRLMPAPSRTCSPPTRRSRCRRYGIARQWNCPPP